MKKKFLGVALSVAMVASLLAGCGGSSSDDGGATEAPATDATEAPAADATDAPAADEGNATSGDLIKVGIINNDPNESGYRTANVEDLKAKTSAELNEELVAAKKELFNLRFQNATNQLDNTSRIKEVRKNIARIQTVITEQANASK